MASNFERPDSVADEREFPPTGFVDRYGAAAILGVSFPMVDRLKRTGRLKCDGILVRGRHGVACRIYAIDALKRARDAMAAAEAKENCIPEGHVDINGAAAFFGTHKSMLNGWQIEGRLSRGTWVKRPGRKRFRVFALAELERVKAKLEAEMAAEAARPVAPVGFIALHEAARRLGITARVLGHWREQGRIASGKWAKIPSVAGRTKVYPVAEIERLHREIRHAAENFPPLGWLEMESAARRANVSIHVWKTWLGEGRVEHWQWATGPTGKRCKLFNFAEVDRVVAELGRDHDFFLEPDGAGGWRLPDGYVGSADAANIFGVCEGTIREWRRAGHIRCGRWARAPVGSGVGVRGRRAFPVDQLHRLAETFATTGKAYLDPNDPSIARVPVMSWRETRFEAIIDAADLPSIEGMRWNWMAGNDGEEAKVVLSAPSGAQVPLRRIVLGLPDRHAFITHRNGEALDCRRANLVIRSQSETNGHARKRPSVAGVPCISRFKGVSWDKHRERWAVSVAKDGVVRRLGRFHDEIAAAQAYDEAARELFGEHARLNFPDGVDARLEREARERDAA